MPLVKCPRCELNYMQPTDRYCSVCRREMNGQEEKDTFEICPNCGERPVAPGEEFCLVCLKEMSRTEGFADENSETPLPEEASIDLPGASEMDEIEIPIEDEPIPDGEFKVIKRELEADDDEAFESLEALEDLESEENDEEDDE